MPTSPRSSRSPGDNTADNDTAPLQPAPRISTSAPPGPSTSAGMSSSAHVAHHIHEFGDVEEDAIVHVQHSDDSEREEEVPVYGARVSLDPTARKPAVRRSHASKAVRRMFRKRTLMQYFYNNVLFRTKQGRRVSREELFLDLVLVGAIATLGHHLRETSITWPNIEIFLLLYAVIYSAWRQIVLLWNYWGVKEDMYDKIGIYFTFLFIVGISLGAYNPFTDRVRRFVGICSFLASFTPLLESFLWARRDTLLSTSANKANTLTVGCICSTVSLLPLLAAAFVPTDRLARILFWVSVGLQMVTTALPTYVVRYLHRKKSRVSRPAISIEHAAEKFEVLTMIFLGETVIALLSEGAPLVASEGSRSGLLYVAAFLCTAMLYSFQTLYIQVDNRILRRGRHALRHDARHGLVWAATHMLYHLSLVLVATGVGLALRDVAFPPSGKYADGHADSGAEHVAVAALEAVVRAGGVEKGKENFTRAARWVFSVGWGATLICSALLSTAHVGGPRAATKEARVATRCVVATGLLVGMPFADVSALSFIAVLAAVAAVLAIGEFLLVQFDRIGLFRSEPSPRVDAGDPESAGGPRLSSSGDADGPRVRDARGDVGYSSDSSTDSGDGGVGVGVGKTKEMDNLDDALRGLAAAPLQRRNAVKPETPPQTASPRDSQSPPQAGNTLRFSESAPGALEDAEMPDVVARALQRRLTRGNTSRLVAVQQSSDDRRKRRHALG